MKTKFCFALLFILITMASFEKTKPFVSSLSGAWQLKTGDREEVIIFQDGYFSHTSFDKKNKQFISTYGGVYGATGERLKLNIEFDTRSTDNVGKDLTAKYMVSGDQLVVDFSNMSQSFQRVDNGTDHLAGVWRITGRMVDGKLNQMQRGDRKTLKLLSGTRFQWMAINPATKEFFGTGGGTYTFKDGQYEEVIEFFSRDSSRVGASLQFNGSVKDGVWNHSGKSSKGDPLNEVWTKEKY